MENNMRDILIDLIRQSHCVDVWDYLNDDFMQPNPIETLADHLIENGVIVPPCKVGNTVYTIFERKIEALEIVCSSRTTKNPEDVYEHYDARNNFLIMPFSDCHIGKTVFLTKDEAEQKLKELGENGNL